MYVDLTRDVLGKYWRLLMKYARTAKALRRPRNNGVGLDILKTSTEK
jgi:hypothetical protein